MSVLLAPPPYLPLEVTLIDGHTQTGATYTRDKATLTFINVTHTATQVASRPHVWSSATQTSITAALSQDQATQVLIRPRRQETFTQTGRPGTFHRPSQTDRLALTDTATSMASVLVATTGCQAGAYFDNEVIPPGVPRPRLPWAYTYNQFEALLTAYPTVHPEDFITFGVLQAQPRRGSQREWGEVAGVLAHMAGGRRLLAHAFYNVMRRIQRLGRNDPMRAVEEEALVALVLDERRRSSAPLGDGAYATLAAPGGPLALAVPQRRPRQRPPAASSVPPAHRPTSPRQGPSRGRGRRPYRASPGPSGAQGGPCRPPPGFVDLTTEEDMDTPATPPPHVSSGDEEMNTDEEDAYFGPHDHAGDSSSDDGSQQV